ncbi:MAG: hypothetical protein NTZ01_01770 [Verrucomicrobia bacterium]|nr:hypothetical protein [Verrucomicrobiota bacterium]
MNQETLVRPEKTVKILMTIVALSLLTIAVCMVILVSRPPAVSMRRPVIPMDNRMSMMRNEQPPMIPGGLNQGGPMGQGMPEGMNRPGQLNQPSQPAQLPEKPAKK